MPVIGQLAPFLYTHTTTAAATTTIKTGQGILHAITINNPGTGTAGSITIYDSTTGSGTVIAIPTGGVYGTLKYDVNFSNGLTIVTVAWGTTQADFTVCSA